MFDYVKKTIQAMNIKFAVKIVQLRVYMTFVSAVTLTFIQDNKYAANLRQ